MKKLKYFSAFVALNLYAGLTSIYAQATDNTATVPATSNTTTSNAGTMSPTGIILGAVALVALAAVIFMMYRNRKNTIGGIQSQNKPTPEPPTTQSINNPGAGV